MTQSEVGDSKSSQPSCGHPTSPSTSLPWP